MELVAWCVYGGFETSGIGFGKGSILGGGDGDGEWSSVIGVVGIFLVEGRFLTVGGELVGLLENRLSITWLIAKISSWLSSSESLTSSLASKGWEISDGVNDEVRLATI